MFADGDYQQQLLQHQTLIQQLLAVSAANSSASSESAQCGDGFFQFPTAQSVVNTQVGSLPSIWNWSKPTTQPQPIPWYKMPKKQYVYEPKIEFGIRGDSLMNTKAESGKKQKYKTFKAEFETEFWKSFGACGIDYSLSPGLMVRDVTTAIQRGQMFDILCVGIGINDLLLHDGFNKIVDRYPSTLDNDLRGLADAIKRKSGRSLVLVGGPASVWKYPKTWDTYIERAIQTLIDADLHVVPLSDAESIMKRMPAAKDGMHFANSDHTKTIFAKEWVYWLQTYVDMDGAQEAKVRKSEANHRTRSRSR